ncbi:F-box/RNI-like/FBD-like domains-containing protein [Artemisia annua]|uniref:F-box/RNI-like/FBD-like domains-containing protein n=1 Tax=Artemisia annua TaxID=35608 RepID=A0A2U1P2W0_ARTAN|nr:F-box/RNI-like/FBD-like domains-containing protein [Artemisia annua]
MFPDDHRKRIRFCWPLFKTCETLVALTLKGKFVLDVPGDVLFPCLKKIDLVSIVYSCDKSLTNLISGCPKLEELNVERLIRDDNLEIFKVSSPFLKRLGQMYKYKFSIEPLCIIEAHVTIDGSISKELLSCLSSAKMLALTNETIWDLTGRAYNLPVFPNLVKLEIGMDSIWDPNWLLSLLNSMPILEHITLSERLRSHYIYRNYDWKPPVEAPDCLRLNMKEILINNETGTHEEFIFIKYLLKHSNNLEKLT